MDIKVVLLTCDISTTTKIHLHAISGLVCNKFCIGKENFRHTYHGFICPLIKPIDCATADQGWIHPTSLSKFITLKDNIQVVL